MRKHIGMVILALLVVLFLAVYMVAFQVSELKDLVVVETFGKTTRVLSGRDPNHAGLHLKWLLPVEETIRFDARTHIFEDTLEETQTNDKYNVILSVFCAWRIEDAYTFIRKIKTVDAAEEAIKTSLRAAKTKAVGSRDLADLINTDPAKMRLEQVEKDFTDGVAREVEEAYGVKIVMVGIRRLGFPPDVTSKVIDVMKAERQSMAADHEAQGEAIATAIRERAKAASAKILAFAKRKEDAIRSDGERAAAEYYKKFRGNEDLAIFTRSLESLEKELANRVVILLDEATLPTLKWLREPPTVESLKQMATTRPAADGKSRSQRR
ncbi:MAG TPA: SPFH domain-containing protein [Phycisphaerae bacterium]|nr:SPFH domain-containing protein [Phycisphaerae bacterium]